MNCEDVPTGEDWGDVNDAKQKANPYPAGTSSNRWDFGKCS